MDIKEIVKTKELSTIQKLRKTRDRISGYYYTESQRQEKKKDTIREC